MDLPGLGDFTVHVGEKGWQRIIGDIAGKHMAAERIVEHIVQEGAVVRAREEVVDPWYRIVRVDIVE